VTIATRAENKRPAVGCPGFGGIDVFVECEVLGISQMNTVRFDVSNIHRQLRSWS